MTSRIDVQETNPLLREATGRNPNSNTFPLKAVLAEVLGTALLANAVAMGTDALHVGLTLAALVFSLGHISGAQLNPAVTLAVFVRGKISAMKGIYYILAQLAGAFLGGLIAMPILEDAVEGSKISAPAIASGVGSMSAVSAEALYTMVLAFVVLTTATTKSQQGQQLLRSCHRRCPNRWCQSRRRDQWWGTKPRDWNRFAGFKRRWYGRYLGVHCRPARWRSSRWWSFLLARKAI